ncbi:19111_t:CDS:2, partial [Gigaspora rosea]
IDLNIQTFELSDKDINDPVMQIISLQINTATQTRSGIYGPGNPQTRQILT